MGDEWAEHFARQDASVVDTARQEPDVVLVVSVDDDLLPLLVGTRQRQLGLPRGLGHVKGQPVGRVTSGNYGHTIGRSCGIARIRADVQLDESFTIDCAGDVYAAEISPRPFYDPDNARLQG